MAKTAKKPTKGAARKTKPKTTAKRSSPQVEATIAALEEIKRRRERHRRELAASPDDRKATSREKTRQRYLPALPFNPDNGVSAAVLFANWILRRCCLLQEAVDRDIKYFRRNPCRVERLCSLWYPANGGDSLRDLRTEALKEIREPHLFGVFHPLIESLWNLYAGFNEKAGQFLNLPYGQRRSDLRRFDLGFLSQVGKAVNAVFDQDGLLPSGKHDNQQIGKSNLPQNGDVRDLCLYLKAKLSLFSSMAACARDFCKTNETDVSKADDLLRQAKRFRHLWQT